MLNDIVAGYTVKEWQEMYSDPLHSDFFELQAKHHAYVDAEEEKVGKCIVCGTGIRITRDYLMFPLKIEDGIQTNKRDVVYLGRIRNGFCSH